MAGVQAIHSFGISLVTYLRNRYPADLREEHACTFRLLSSGEMARLEEDNPGLTLGLYLYRVTVNEQMRVDPLPPAELGHPLVLVVDLHYLAVFWSDNAVAEHILAAWLLSEINARPVLDSSYLSADGQWERDESVQLAAAEMTTEDMMRIWDSLTPSYRLCVPYVARGVRIGPRQAAEGRPVVATRMNYGDPSDGGDG